MFPIENLELGSTSKVVEPLWFIQLTNSARYLIRGMLTLECGRHLFDGRQRGAPLAEACQDKADCQSGDSVAHLTPKLSGAPQHYDWQSIHCASARTIVRVPWHHGKTGSRVTQQQVRHHAWT